MAFATLALNAGIAQATTFNYNLSGSPSSAVLFPDKNAVGAYTSGYIPLLNTATGTNSIPAFTLSVGDVVQATVTLDGIFTIPASRFYAGTDVLLASGFTGLINYNPTVSFFKLGLPVPAFDGQGGFAPFSGSGGSFVLGGVAFSGQPTPSFSFDQMVVQAIITSFMPVATSMTLPTSLPKLEFISFAPVSEPASLALMLLGLSTLAGAARRRGH